MRYQALLDEAMLAAKGRDFARAKALVEEVLTARPASVPALDLLGFTQYFLGDHEAAEATCRRTLELSPDHPYALKGLGLCVAKRGAIDEAVALLEKAIGLRPEWFDPYWDLCVTLVDAQRHVEAVRVVQRAREAIPDRASDWDRMERHARSAGARSLR